MTVQFEKITANIGQESSAHTFYFPPTFDFGKYRCELFLCVHENIHCNNLHNCLTWNKLELLAFME